MTAPLPGMASSIYGKSNLAVRETGGKVLDISIATPQIGGQEIDMIRRPVAGEDTSNAPKLSERYWSQVGMRILLSDYGSDGTCAKSDISSTSTTALPGLSTNLTASSSGPRRRLTWRRWLGIQARGPVRRPTAPRRAGSILSSEPPSFPCPRQGRPAHRTAIPTDTG